MYSIGCLTYRGYVTASDEWNGKTKFKKVKNALKYSFEDVFHNLTDDHVKNFLLPFKDNSNEKNLNEIKQMFSHERL